MAGVDLVIPPLGDKFIDYRSKIPASFTWGPVVDASKVRYFCFHHSVTKQTAKIDKNWEVEVKNILAIHMQENHWASIGYRIVICSDGTVVYCGDLSHGGSGVSGNNDIIISTCLVGDFTKELPTAAQVHSAHTLADWFISHMPQYPLIDGWEDVIGHKEAAEIHLPGADPTQCPGSNWKTGVDTLYSRIRDDRYQGYPDPQPAGIVTPPVPVPVITEDTFISQVNLRVRDIMGTLSTLRSENEALKRKIEAAKQALA